MIEIAEEKLKNFVDYPVDYWVAYITGAKDQLKEDSAKMVVLVEKAEEMLKQIKELNKQVDGLVSRLAEYEEV